MKSDYSGMSKEDVIRYLEETEGEQKYNYLLHRVMVEAANRGRFSSGTAHARAVLDAAINYLAASTARDRT